MAGAHEQAPMHSTSSSEIKPSPETSLFFSLSDLQACSQRVFRAHRLASDVGTHLHVKFAQRLAMKHRIVADDFIHLERSHATAAGHFFHEFAIDTTYFVLRVQAASELPPTASVRAGSSSVA